MFLLWLPYGVINYNRQIYKSVNSESDWPESIMSNNMKCYEIAHRPNHVQAARGRHSTHRVRDRLLSVLHE